MQLKKLKSKNLDTVQMNGKQICLQSLNTIYLGINTIYYKTIDSTQNEIWRRLKSKDITSGTLVIADIQTAGQGTHGRTWYTDEENNIAFSFLIELNCDIKKIDGLTKEIANIIIQIFEDKYGIYLQIKEPNDIYFKEKKLGGILTQTQSMSNKVKYLVCRNWNKYK